MNRGRYEQISPKRRVRKPTAPLLVLALLVLSIGVGSTLAYIIAQTDDVTNSFIPGEVKCAVNDDLSITNDSNIKVYIRAMVVVNWMDNAGNIYGIAPAYTATITDGWSCDLPTGIYYYNSAVDPNSATITPPATVECNEPAPNGYSLVIEVIAEAIQAEGLGADVDTAQEAWTAAFARSGNG